MRWRMRMNREVSDIISDLMKVGAKIPDLSSCEWMSASVVNTTLYLDELQRRAHHADEYGFDTKIAIPILDIVEKSIDKWQDGIAEDKIRAMRDEIHKIRGQLSGERYITREDYEKVPSFEKLSNQFSMAGIEAIMECACVRKGDIVAAVKRGIETISPESDPIPTATVMNIIWQDTIAALNRKGVLTAEEADRLVKEVRW